MMRMLCVIVIILKTHCLVASTTEPDMVEEPMAFGSSVTHLIGDSLDDTLLDAPGTKTDYFDT